jgi:hypothetical protein
MEISKFVLLLPLAFLLSCGSTPRAASVPSEPAAPPPAAEVPQQPEQAPAFDPGKVSQQVKDTTKEDVQKFIGNLNTVIRSKNFNAWKAALSDEYVAYVSSAENLQRWNDSPALKTRKIVLKNAEDYFNYVVVPSRTSTRVDDTVDDIEFVTQTRVKAYTIKTMKDGSEERLRLYDLEQSGNTWKIIN